MSKYTLPVAVLVALLVGVKFAGSIKPQLAKLPVVGKLFA